MQVSVVICTYNRAHSLGATLESLRYQNHEELEVIVVNGPSTDGTEQVLEPWADRIRIEQCPVANLSVSRNIGIRAAAGEIVAFIDDDALPEYDWLMQSLPAFDNDEIAGVGGIVFDHTGLALQYRYSAANRFAEVAVRHDKPFDGQCFPGSFQFPYLQGTNALFRREALLQIGGFDETFDYYLDETDVCCRLVDAGFVLRQLPNAPVHHKFLPSSVRDHQRVITNWYPIVKNQVYFSYRHALDPYTEQDIHDHSDAFIASRIHDVTTHEQAGRLPPGSVLTAQQACASALIEGTRLGRKRHGLRLGPVAWPAPNFTTFPTLERSGRRKLTIVSSSFAPNVTGGIARFISDLAPAMARRGHEVRVITRAVGPPAVDLEDGVWVHRIAAPPIGAAGVAPDALAPINEFTTAALDELARIAQWSSHDVVYGPLWDVEILGALRHTALPIAVQVATPLAIAADMAGLLSDPGSAAVIAHLMTLENEVLASADLFHANSAAVADTIAEHYAHVAEPGRWAVVHLGLVDHSDAAIAEGRSSATPQRRVVLFVGRFEVRKGIDTFLEAVARLAGSFPDVDFVAVGEDRPLESGQPMFGASWLAEHRHEPWFKQIRFEGSVADERLHELYSQAELVVLPSRYESFGLVVVEAMIHAKPVISCDTSGIRDVVTNGIDGVLVEPGNANELERAMADLLQDPERRAALGAAARRRFVDDFHVDRFAERFERFVDRVCLVDASHGVPNDGQSLVLRRSRFGYSEAVLAQESGITFSTRMESATRLAFEAMEPSTVVIDDGVCRELSAMPGVVTRVPIGSGSASVQLTVVNGRVAVAGLIEVSVPTALAPTAAVPSTPSATTTTS